MEWAATTLQLQPPLGVGLRPGAVLSVSPGWWVPNKSFLLQSLVYTNKCIHSIRLCSNRMQGNISEKHKYTLSQWKNVNQGRFALGRSNWNEHVCQVPAPWDPDKEGIWTFFININPKHTLLWVVYFFFYRLPNTPWLTKLVVLLCAKRYWFATKESLKIQWVVYNIQKTS